LLAHLLALSYALLAQANVEAGGMAPNHIHVTLERLIDKAIMSLG
jgi:hypothetical protein